MVARIGLTGFTSVLNDLMHTSQVTYDGQELSLDEGAKAAVSSILKAKEDGANIILVGNGGSAAIVSHMQNDLCAAVGVRAMTFCDAPLLTAMSNDFGYETAYEKPMSLWASPGDLLVAISSSGQSENILKCAQLAAKNDMTVMTFTGFKDDNPLRRSGDLNFYVPSTDYGYVETIHSVMTHYITDAAKSLCTNDC